MRRTPATTVPVAEGGARGVRVHDVAPNVDVVHTVAAVRAARAAPATGTAREPARASARA